MKLDDVASVLNEHGMVSPEHWGREIQDSELVSELWQSSENYRSFVDELLKHDYFDFQDSTERDIYAYFSKRNFGNHWYRIRSVFGDKQFKTYSDIGSLLINNNTLIHNGHGDGTTRVAVFNKDDDDYRGTGFFYDMMHPCIVSFSGKIDIYDYDIKGEGEVIKTINGDYDVFIYDGLIAFVEI